MKLHMDNPGLSHRIRACDPDGVTIQQQRYARSLLVSPDHIMPDWPPTGPDELQAAHFDQVAELEPEVVLLGTGDQLRFPAPSILRILHERQIGVEVMTTQAACRTFNILLAEDRRVVAALIINATASPQ